MKKNGKHLEIHTQKEGSKDEKEGLRSLTQKNIKTLKDSTK